VSGYTDWEGICAFMGYVDLHAMLEDLYNVQKLSVQEIGRRIGVSPVGIRRQLHKNNIQVRQQGGAQAFPKKHYFLHLLDQRWVFSTTLQEIGRVMRTNPTYVMHYRRKVKGHPVDGKFANERTNDELLSDTAGKDSEPSFEE